MSMDAGEVRVWLNLSFVPVNTQRDRHPGVWDLFVLSNLSAHPCQTSEPSRERLREAARAGSGPSLSIKKCFNRIVLCLDFVVILTSVYRCETFRPEDEVEEKVELPTRERGKLDRSKTSQLTSLSISESPIVGGCDFRWLRCRAEWKCITHSCV